MSTTGYRRLTWGLGVFSALLLMVVALLFLHKDTETMMDVRYARDIIIGFEMRRDFALNRGVTEAASALYSLQVPPGSQPFQNPLADFVERERRRAIADVIAFLRAKSGKDLGDAPAPWIFEFGDETTRHMETNFVERSGPL